MALPDGLAANAKLGFGVAVGFLLLGLVLAAIQFGLAKAKG
jgi:hypothetical protein